MQSTTTTVTASDGIALHTNRWLPDGAPKGVVQIAHGLGEHSGRYARLAEALTAPGYAVYAHDHRGHGATASDADHGFFADRDGWATVVEDLRAVTRFAQEENPGLPVFLLGHSMGSYLVRCYVIENSRDLAGIVLSATGGDPGWLGKVGPLVARTEARLRGGRHVSTLLQGLLNGPYNGAFKPNRTSFDWLSRDEAEVDKYVADELCGRTATSSSSSIWARGWPSATTDARSPGCDATCRCSSSRVSATPPVTTAQARGRQRAVLLGRRRRRHLHPVPGRTARDLQRDQPRRGHGRPHPVARRPPPRLTHPPDRPPPPRPSPPPPPSPPPQLSRPCGNLQFTPSVVVRR